MYRLSYLYTVVIGFTITFVIGYVVSRLLKALKFSGTEDVHLDGNKNLTNFDLFFPPIARRLKKHHITRERLLSNSNNLPNNVSMQKASD